MTVAPPSDRVREVVIGVFAEYGIVVRNLLDLDETIMVENGRYRGRSYRAGGLMAMWLIAAGLVQFYDADGNMLRTVNLFREQKPKAIAA